MYLWLSQARSGDLGRGDYFRAEKRAASLYPLVLAVNCTVVRKSFLKSPDSVRTNTRPA